MTLLLRTSCKWVPTIRPASSDKYHNPSVAKKNAPIALNGDMSFLKSRERHVWVLSGNAVMNYLEVYDELDGAAM